MEKSENAHTVQWGSLCPDRTQREDQLMVLPSHNPLLCVGEGFYILRASPAKTAAWAPFLLAGMRGTQPLHKFEKRCPDKSAGAFAGYPQNLCRALLRAAGRPPVPAVKRTEGSLRRRCAPPGLRPRPPLAPVPAKGPSRPTRSETALLYSLVCSSRMLTAPASCAARICSARWVSPQPLPCHRSAAGA